MINSLGLPGSLSDRDRREEFFIGFRKACKTNKVILRPKDRHRVRDKLRYSDWFFLSISNEVEDIRERVFDKTFQEVTRISNLYPKCEMIILQQIEWFRCVHLSSLLSEILKLQHLLKQLNLGNSFAQRLLTDLDEFAHEIKRRQSSLDTAIKTIFLSQLFLH